MLRVALRLCVACRAQLGLQTRARLLSIVHHQCSRSVPKNTIRLCGLQGTINLVDACRNGGVKRVVLVTSLGTDDGLLSPLGPVLFWKKRAEEHLQRSGLTYTIVRPGGLASESGSSDGSSGSGGNPLQQALSSIFGQARARGEGNLVSGQAGTFGLPPKRSGSIKRSMVRNLALCSPAVMRNACVFLLTGLRVCACNVVATFGCTLSSMSGQATTVSHRTDMSRDGVLVRNRWQEWVSHE